MTSRRIWVSLAAIVMMAACAKDSGSDVEKLRREKEELEAKLKALQSPSTTPTTAPSSSPAPAPTPPAAPGKPELVEILNRTTRVSGNYSYVGLQAVVENPTTEGVDVQVPVKGVDGGDFEVEKQFIQGHVPATSRRALLAIAMVKNDDIGKIVKWTPSGDIRVLSSKPPGDLLSLDSRVVKESGNYAYVGLKANVVPVDAAKFNVAVFGVDQDGYPVENAVVSGQGTPGQQTSATGQAMVKQDDFHAIASWVAPKWPTPNRQASEGVPASPAAPLPVAEDGSSSASAAPEWDRLQLAADYLSALYKADSASVTVTDVELAPDPSTGRAKLKARVTNASQVPIQAWQATVYFLEEGGGRIGESTIVRQTPLLPGVLTNVEGGLECPRSAASAQMEVTAVVGMPLTPEQLLEAADKHPGVEAQIIGVDEEADVFRRKFFTPEEVARNLPALDHAITKYAFGRSLPSEAMPESDLVEARHRITVRIRNKGDRHVARARIALLFFNSPRPTEGGAKPPSGVITNANLSGKRGNEPRREVARWVMDVPKSSWTLYNAETEHLQMSMLSNGTALQGAQNGNSRYLRKLERVLLGHQVLFQLPMELTPPEVGDVKVVGGIKPGYTHEFIVELYDGGPVGWGGTMDTTEVTLVQVGLGS